jgi:hypothetical protein
MNKILAIINFLDMLTVEELKGKLFRIGETECNISKNKKGTLFLKEKESGKIYELNPFESIAIIDEELLRRFNGVEWA